MGASSRVFLKLGAVLCLAGAAALGQAEQVVNVYSHRHYETDQRLYERFQRETGIAVRVVQAGAAELIERLRAEGARSPADLLITVDAGRLQWAKALGLLQPAGSRILEQTVPAGLRDPEGTWFGLTTRARVIVYAKDRVDPRELAGYEELTDPRWRGRLLVRSSTSEYNQSLLAWLIEARGEQAARLWAEGMVANFARAPKGNDRDQVKAVVAGEGDIALVNTYYIGLLLNSEDPEERKVGAAVGVAFPRETHLNISGAGITASSRNAANARRLLEFLVSEEAQRVFADANYEYPVNPQVRPSALLASWGQVPASPTGIGNLGKHYEAALRIFDLAGWR